MVICIMKWPTTQKCRRKGISCNINITKAFTYDNKHLAVLLEKRPRRMVSSGFLLLDFLLKYVAHYGCTLHVRSRGRCRERAKGKRFECNSLYSDKLKLATIRYKIETNNRHIACIT